MTGETSLLKALLLAVGSFFGYKKEQAVRENSPEMRAAQAGRTDQEIKDGAAKAIAGQDIEKIRKELAE